MSLNLDIKLQGNALHLLANTQIPATGVTAFFGPSGCGKTTVLRLIAGLETATVDPAHSKVDVEFNGQRWTQNSVSKLAAWNRKVGYVTQQSTLFPHMTVRQNLLFAWKRARNKKSDFQPQTIMSQTSIEDLSERYPDQLSGGQQQRVALARALCSCPQLLLLDEPLANLDGSARASLLTLLQRVKGIGIPIIYVSHQMDEVCVIADYIALFKEDRDYTEVVTGELEQMLTHLKPETLVPVWLEQEGKRARALVPLSDAETLGLELALARNNRAQ